jgi:hypothetical protein
MSKKQVISFISIIVIIALGYLFFRKNTPEVSLTTSKAAGTVLTTSDVTCAGMFLTPAVQYNIYTAAYPVAMRYENGSRHYFMYDGTGHVIEFPEPQLSPCSSSFSNAQRATRESWGGDWGTMPVNQVQGFQPGNGNASTPAYGLFYDDTTDQLVLNWTGNYSNSGFRNSFATASLNNSNHTLSVQGCWGLSDRTTLYTGGLALNIPTSFANAHLPGAHLAVGVAGPIGQAAQNSYGPTIIALPPLTPNPCSSTADNLIHSLKVLAEYPANGNGPNCYDPDAVTAALNVGCTPTKVPTAPYPAQMAFNQYSNVVYPEGWSPYQGHGWYTFATAGSIGWYDDGIKSGVIVPTEVSEGWANTTIRSTPAPTLSGANGTMYLTSTSTHDGLNMNPQDLIWVQTCTPGNPADGAGCVSANLQHFSFVIIDSVDPSTGKVDFHIAGFDSGSGNHLPVVGSSVTLGGQYAHGSPTFSRGTYRLQIYDPAQYAEVIAGTRLPYNVKYDTEMDLTTFVKGFGCPSCGGGVGGTMAAGHYPVSTITDPQAHQFMVTFKDAASPAYLISNAVYVFNTGSNSVTPPTASPGTPPPAPSPSPSPISPSPSPSPVTPSPTPVSPTLVPAGGVSDNFDRANSNNAGSNWTSIQGFVDILSNTLVQDTSSTYETENIWAGNTFDADQYSQATLASTPAFAEAGGVIVRASGKQGTRTLYIYSADNNGKGKIDKVINGTSTNLTQNLSAISQGDVIKLQIIGSTLTAYKNGVLQATVTDSSIPSGQPGIFIYSLLHQATKLDNWSGNNIVSVTPAPAPAPAPVTPPPTLVGDLNDDGIVNSLDWSYMNSKWFTSDATADLNHDGIVNSIDFSILNNNWQKGS